MLALRTRRSRRLHSLVFFIAPLGALLFPNCVLAQTTSLQGSAPASATQTKTRSPTGSAAQGHNVPSFRVYRAKLADEMVSVAVSPNTSNEQLKNLLWLFREKVRAHRFKDIGLSDEWENGKGGVIEVYRGERCANEEFINGNGPCGYGEHYSAAFQWGLLVNGIVDVNADEGLLGTLTDGDIVFASAKDHWQLPGVHR